MNHKRIMKVTVCRIHRDLKILPQRLNLYTVGYYFYFVEC